MVNVKKNENDVISLKKLRLQYAWAKQHLNIIDKQLHINQKLSIGQKIYNNVIIIIFSSIPIIFLYLFLPLLFLIIFIIIMPLFSIIGLNEHINGIRKMQKEKKQVHINLQQIENNIIKILENNNSKFHITENRKKYFSNINLNTEFKNNYDDFSKNNIIVNFYDIPHCFKRFEDIAYNIEICDTIDKKPILPNGENVIEKWTDLKLEMNKQGKWVSSVKQDVFPLTMKKGTLYITEHRLIYIREPCLKGYKRCTSLLKKESKEWKELGKNESLSIPYNLIIGWREDDFFKSKELEIYIMNKLNKYNFRLISVSPITSIFSKLIDRNINKR